MEETAQDGPKIEPIGSDGWKVHLLYPPEGSERKTVRVRRLTVGDVQKLLKSIAQLQSDNLGKDDGENEVTAYSDLDVSEIETLDHEDFHAIQGVILDQLKKLAPWLKQ